MKKSLLTLSTALIATSILAGCNNANPGNGVNNNAMGPRKVGYYTDQNRANRYNDMAINNRNATPNPNDINNATPNNMNDMNNVNNVNNGGYNSALANQIKNRVTGLSGVNNASVLVNGNNVIVGVNTNNNNTNNNQALEQQIISTVKGVAGNKKVQVVTDKNMVQRIGNVNDRINNGSAANEVQSDIRAILNDLGDAVQRPFQNNAK